MRKLNIVYFFVFVFVASVQVTYAQSSTSWWLIDNFNIDYQYVDVTIQDQVATTHIDMQLTNASSEIATGSFLLSIPAGATVNSLTVWVDGVAYNGDILVTDPGDDPSNPGGNGEPGEPAQIIWSLGYVNPEMVRIVVFPIAPNESRRIEIGYQQILEADNGLVRYTFPPLNDLYTQRSVIDQQFNITVDSNEEIRTVYSPSHEIDVARADDFSAAVTHTVEGLPGLTQTAATQNITFDLFYSVSTESIGLNLLSANQPNEDGYFLLFASPSVDVGEEEIVEKDVILVFDTSGSMGGEKIEQARNALLDVVSRLNPEDRFNIVAFNSGVQTYSDTLVPASNPGDYTSFVNDLNANGGTNISEGLFTALDMAGEDRFTTILFLTDGHATDGISDVPTLVELVAQNITDNVRLFSFGVGSGADTNLLDTLTNEFRGSTTYIQSQSEVEQAVTDFYTSIGDPLFTNLAIDFGDLEVYDMYPSTIPDIFAGSQIVLAGRYQNDAITTTVPITLTGLFNGITQTFVYSGTFVGDTISSQPIMSGTLVLTGTVVLPAIDEGEAFISQLWANRAIDTLLTEIRLNGETPELVAQIITIGNQYGIVTPYTSFVLEEPTAVSLVQWDVSQHSLLPFIILWWSALTVFMICARKRSSENLL